MTKVWQTGLPGDSCPNDEQDFASCMGEKKTLWYGGEAITE
jgi:hypothetical protein